MFRLLARLIDLVSRGGDSPAQVERRKRAAITGTALGFGPMPFRIALIVVATAYYFMLLKPPELHGAARTIGFFAQSTALFPRRDEFALEFRLEAWSCASQTWVPMDMRPYFPMRADDKESRFQRLAYFYNRERTVMVALDDYLVARHAAGGEDDAVTGTIGGIRLYEWKRAIPELGTTIDRYEFRPLAAVPAAERTEKYWTKSSRRAQRCGRRVGSGSGSSESSGGGDGSGSGGIDEVAP